jgi:hypothetical protein
MQNKIKKMKVSKTFPRKIIRKLLAVDFPMVSRRI